MHIGIYGRSLKLGGTTKKHWETKARWHDKTKALGNSKWIQRTGYVNCHHVGNILAPMGLCHVGKIGHEVMTKYIRCTQARREYHWCNNRKGPRSNVCSRFVTERFKLDDRICLAFFGGISTKCKHTGCVDESAWRVKVVTS